MVIKYSWQRARRGWADCDVWSIDYWFEVVMPEMLEKLANNHLGAPMDFAVKSFPDDYGEEPEYREDGFAHWEKTLKHMAHSLRARQRHSKKWYGDAETEGAYGGTSVALDNCGLEELEAMETITATLEAFKTYYFNLWD
jgi:hypothetical protein